MRAHSPSSPLRLQASALPPSSHPELRGMSLWLDRGRADPQSRKLEFMSMIVVATDSSGRKARSLDAMSRARLRLPCLEVTLRILDGGSAAPVMQR